MHTTPLTALLAELDAALVATGAPFLEMANPGIDEDEVTAALADAGLSTPPTELLEWWRWHNGSRLVQGRYLGATIGPGGWTLLSLDEALADRARWMELWPSGSEMPWDPTWLPIAGLGAHTRLAVLLDDSTTERAQVGIIDMFDDDTMNTAERSLAEVVTTWLRALEQRYVWWDAARQAWDMEEPTRPEFRLYS
ncbi:SMI1/KNR4 family protein [Cellulomonas sp. URHD0024]|uniref:SMI1/KNR4 family protein n=1 Tax=Cellulomonas sp. URHD0024 TaxID=1302620 RepID=UPI0004071E6A|nr:SMI1/KNR4 family protein [Cellulomonas sp. URHD0024]